MHLEAHEYAKEALKHTAFETSSTSIQPLTNITPYTKDTMAPAAHDPMADMLNTSPTRKIAPQKTLVEPTIPCFDLEAIDRTTGQARKEEIAKFVDALINVGFIGIKADEIHKILNQVYTLCENYFSQDLETKKLDIHSNNNLSGYVTFNSETAAGASVADLKEFFHIVHSSRMSRWPNTPKEFQSLMEQYYSIMSSCLVKMIGFLCEHFENDPNNAMDMQDPANLIRLIHYPQSSPDDPKDALRSAPHKDLNLLTLLPPGTSPGLELRTKNGTMEPVKVPEKYLIVNSGDQLEYWTGGLIESIQHQVRNPTEKEENKARYQAVFFGSLPMDYSIKPIKKCVDQKCIHMTSHARKAYENKFHDIKVLDFLLARQMEIGYFPNPTKEFVLSFVEKGLLRNPSEKVREMLLEMFKGESISEIWEKR